LDLKNNLTHTFTNQMSITLHTDLGDLKLELFCEQVPKATENFLAHCASGYYDGCKVHRNIKGFLMQSGDPSGSGKGGNSIWGRKFEDEFDPQLRHNQRGMLSMANSRKPDTNGSQFFITYAKQPSLDLKHSVFGKVIDGFDVLDFIEKVPVDAKNRPTVDILIRNATIHANPFAEIM